MKEPILKLRALGSKHQCYQALAEIQELGSVHLMEPSARYKLQRIQPPHQMETISELISKFQHWLEMGSKLKIPEPKPQPIHAKLLGLISRFLDFFRYTPPPKISLRPRTQLLKESQELISKLESEFSELLSLRQSLSSQFQQIREQLERLAPLAELRIPGKLLRSSELLGCCVARIHPEDLAKIQSEFPEIWISGVNGFSILIVPKMHESKLLDVVKRHGELISIPDTDQPISEYIHELRGKLDEISKQLSDLESKLRDLWDRYELQIIELNELLKQERSRLRALSKLGETQYCFLLEGYVLERDLSRVSQKLDELGMVYQFQDPDDPPECVPVKLRNPRWIKPFEFLTEMYGLPYHNTIDPTPFMGIGFLVYYAFMLGDALYGLISVAVCIPLLRGLGRRNPIVGDLLKILIMGGIATIFFGILTGGYMGNLLTKYFGMDIRPLWADPFGKVIVWGKQIHGIMFFLGISILIGLVWINIGIGLGIYQKIKQRAILDAIHGLGWLLPLQAGILIMLIPRIIGAELEFLKPWGSPLIAAGVILGIFKHKKPFFDPMNVLLSSIGMLGGLFSYARLVALMLATYILAMVGNMGLGAGKVFGMLGAFLGAIWFVFMQFISIGFNVAGGAVQALRLNYVEFFNWFYQEAGAPKFSPFSQPKEIYIRI